MEAMPRGNDYHIILGDGSCSDIVVCGGPCLFCFYVEQESQRQLQGTWYLGSRRYGVYWQLWDSENGELGVTWKRCLIKSWSLWEHDYRGIPYDNMLGHDVCGNHDLFCSCD